MYTKIFEIIRFRSGKPMLPGGIVDDDNDDKTTTEYYINSVILALMIAPKSYNSKYMFGGFCHFLSRHFN